MTDTYTTIESPSHGLFKEKGSKFISIAIPVSTEDEIKTHLDGIKKKYHDARHHCFAYSIGPDHQNIRSNDDGEPTNSAGKPILGQIYSAKLTNILVVVVRYFGGTLLGVGGLITAYKNAAADAISNAALVQKEICDTILFECTYNNLSQIMKLARDENLNIQNQRFTDSCEITIDCRKSKTQEILSRVSTNLYDVHFKILNENDDYQ
jgi:uncharacterized YigZ family protein